MEVINMTPHPIVVENGDARRVYEPSGEVARVIVKTTMVGEVDGFPVVRNVVAGDNLPSEKEGVLIIVSAMVLGLRPDRKDLIAPDTNNAKRNEKGHIVSVPGFVRA